MKSLEYQVNPQVSFRQVGDETVLVDFGSDTIFSLNRTGGMIWAHLSQGLGVEEIVSRVTEAHDVSLSLAAAEIGSLLADLERRGLIEERSHCMEETSG